MSFNGASPPQVVGSEPSPVRHDALAPIRPVLHRQVGRQASELVGSLFLHWDGHGRFRILAEEDGVLSQPLRVDLTRPPGRSLQEPSYAPSSEIPASRGMPVAASQQTAVDKWRAGMFLPPAEREEAVPTSRAAAASAVLFQLDATPPDHTSGVSTALYAANIGAKRPPPPHIPPPINPPCAISSALRQEATNENRHVTRSAFVNFCLDSRPAASAHPVDPVSRRHFDAGGPAAVPPVVIEPVREREGAFRVPSPVHSPPPEISHEATKDRQPKALAKEAALGSMAPTETHQRLPPQLQFPSRKQMEKDRVNNTTSTGVVGSLSEACTPM